MFDPSTVPYIGIREYSKNGVKIIFSKDKFYLLENDFEPWMCFDPETNWQIKQFAASYYLAKGNVLITGLGFGLQALWIASKPTVQKVRVIERSPEVIEAFLASNDKPDNMEIILADANKYTTDEHFDFIALDHYETESWHDILKSAKTITKNIPNHDVSWIWSFEYNYTKDFYPGYRPEDRPDYSSMFDLYRRNVMEGIRIPSLPADILNECIYLYFDQSKSENRLKAFEFEKM